jgi:hypothetical protein
MENNRVSYFLFCKTNDVNLAIDLPPRFGNHRTIVAAAFGSCPKGYVTSEGFEKGKLKVPFTLQDGDVKVQFNVLSAAKYLECDAWG